MWVGDAAQSPIFAGTEALDVIVNAGSRACASVPIRAPSGDIVAMLNPHYGRTTSWTTQQKHDLTLLATKTGAAIHDLGR